MPYTNYHYSITIICSLNSDSWVNPSGYESRVEWDSLPWHTNDRPAPEHRPLADFSCYVFMFFISYYYTDTNNDDDGDGVGDNDDNDINYDYCLFIIFKGTARPKMLSDLFPENTFNKFKLLFIT